MANLKKTVTYPIPDTWHATTTALGRTGTVEYDGPAKLHLHLEKESNMIKDVQDAEDICEQPTPLDFYELELDCDASDENAIRCIMIGPWSIPLQINYEVKVGPDNQRNGLVRDPSHVYSVIDQNSVVYGYNPETKTWGDLTFDTGRAGDDVGQTADHNPGRDNWDWDFIRSARADDLQASDMSTSSDMPEAHLAKWTEYRRQLRDLPEEWAGVPVDLVQVPQDPDCADSFEHERYPGHLDPDVVVVEISDRTAEDEAKIVAAFDGVAVE